MQMYAHLVWLALACSIVLIQARDIRYNLYNQWNDEDSNLSEQSPEQMVFNVHRYNRRPIAFGKLVIDPNIDNEALHEQQRSVVAARRAQSIVKGDPREFMG